MKTFRVVLDTATTNAVFDRVAEAFVKHVEGFIFDAVFDDGCDLTAGEVRSETAAVIAAALSECSKLRIFELPHDADESIFWGRLASSIKTHADQGLFKWEVGLTDGKPFARIVGTQSSNF